jgi:O-antigen/teichoic acid export membrane protein
MKKNKNLLVTVFTVLVPLLLQVFYIRYVSYNVDKDIYGNFVLLQTLIIALSYIFLQIPSSAYTRFYNESEDKTDFVNEFRSLLIIINILSLLVILIYGYFIEKFSLIVLGLIFIYFVLLNNYSFNQQIFLLNLERKKYFFMKLFEAGAKFIFPIVLYFIYETLESFIIGIVLGYSIAFFYLVINLKEYPFKLQYHINNLKKYLVYAYPTIFIGVFSWGISFSDRYFIEYYMETKDVAIYAILAQVAGFGMILGQIYGMYVNPIILKKYEKDSTIAYELLSKYIKILIIVCAVLMIIAKLLPIEFFALLIEKDIITTQYYYYTFFILIGSIFLSVFQNAYAMYFVLSKKLNIINYVYIVAFIINLVGNFFIQKYGMIAAAISTIIAYIVINILQYIYIIKYIKVRDEYIK